MASMLGGASGGMSAGQLGGSLGGGHGRDAGGGGPLDMSNWAYKFYTPYENSPQGRPIQEILSQLGGLYQMAQNQPQKQQWQPQLTDRQGLRNAYIQSLIRGGNGRGI